MQERAYVERGEKEAKKQLPWGPRQLFFVVSKLTLNDSFGGALGSAGTAINTGISVDNVLGIALGNSLDGALLSAGTARHASVSNLVSHKAPPKELYSHCNINFAKSKGKNEQNG